MTLSVYKSGWKTAVPWVNKSGWKRCKQYCYKSGSWRLIYGIPSGLIIMSADGSTPTGWSRFTSADTRFIVGAGSTYGVGSHSDQTIGGNNTRDSSSAGAHYNHAANADCITSAGAYSRNNNVSSGAHIHTATISEYTPKKQSMVLIKANSDLQEVPANGMFFGTSTPSGFSVFSSSSFLASLSYVSENSYTRTVTCGNGGNHNHGIGGATGGTDSYQAGNNGGHNHTLTLGTPVDSFNQAILRGLYKASAYGLQSGLIGMWEGVTAPLGWKLCNGSNSTVDLRDSFILFSTTGNGSISSGATVAMSIGFDSNSWSHNHTADWDNNKLQTGPNYNYRGNSANSDPFWPIHSHTAMDLSFSYLPSYYALTFIQKI